MGSSTNGLTGEDQRFWDQVFRDLLPIAIQAQGWRSGDKPITSGQDRVDLAASWADIAVRERLRRRTEITSPAATPELFAAAPELLAELQHAHRIIRNALNIMTANQKLIWAEMNAADGCDGEGTTRANERLAVLAKAGGNQS